MSNGRPRRRVLAFSPGRHWQAAGVAALSSCILATANSDAALERVSKRERDMRVYTSGSKRGTCSRSNRTNVCTATVTKST